MAEIINQVALWLESLVLTVGYPGIFLVMFAENIFTPIPTEPLMPLAGILAAQGQMSFVIAWVSAITGATLGSVLLYFFGRRGGEPVVRAVIKRWGRITGFSNESLDRALGLFNKYGGWMVFFGRFIPLVRPAVSLVSGISNLPLAIFLPATVLSSTIATGFWLGVGYFLGENWQEFLAAINQYQTPVMVIGGIVGAMVVGYVVIRWQRGRQVAVDATKEALPN
jgi:membrane protein DedA with SNARE-associated domain